MKSSVVRGQAPKGLKKHAGNVRSLAKSSVAKTSGFSLRRG